MCAYAKITLSAVVSLPHDASDEVFSRLVLKGLKNLDGASYRKLLIDRLCYRKCKINKWLRNSLICVLLKPGSKRNGLVHIVQTRWHLTVWLGQVDGLWHPREIHRKGNGGGLFSWLISEYSSRRDHTGMLTCHSLFVLRREGSSQQQIEVTVLAQLLHLFTVLQRLHGAAS